MSVVDISPRWILDVDPDTLPRPPDRVLGGERVGAAVSLADAVDEEAGARGRDPLVRGRGGGRRQLSASLLGPGVLGDGGVGAGGDLQHIGAVHFEIDFFYCINELRLI